MEISRSGYYKWLKNKDVLNQYEINRNELFEIIKKHHKKHPSWGYRRINAKIKIDTGWVVSDNLIHKCCKFLNIKSVVRNYKYKKPGEEHIKYSNIINNNWQSLKPLEKIVTDMTCIKYRNVLYEVVLYLDVFNNEIISYAYTRRNTNTSAPYYKGLYDLLDKLKRIEYQSILHSDQGIIYSSMAFTNAHKDYNIIRSMSRSGTPTDNPVMESINGWIKDEIYNDFDVDSYESFDEFIQKFIYYFNNERPAYALNYKTPFQYKTELGF